MMAKGRKTGGRSWNFRDLTGQKFNRLTAISLNRIEMASENVHGRTFWNCVCECGGEKIVESCNLTRGAVKSCGCLKREIIKERLFIDLTGMKFNRLFVVNFAYKRNENYYWNVICDCGTEKIIEGGKLRSGNTQSCGCLRDQNRLKDFGEATFNQLWLRYSSGAKNRNIEFNLTKNEVKNITQQSCYYCGIKPSQIIKSDCENGDTIYNGIDRLDSSKGYSLDNCVPCCGKCNTAKMAMSRDDFLSWIENVYNYSIKDKK